MKVMPEFKELIEAERASQAFEFLIEVHTMPRFDGLCFEIERFMWLKRSSVSSAWFESEIAPSDQVFERVVDWWTQGSAAGDFFTYVSASPTAPSPENRRNAAQLIALVAEKARWNQPRGRHG